MTEKQLLDFCKSQNWSAKIERMVVNKIRTENFICLKDIGIYNTGAYISFDIDKSSEEITINHITFYGGIKDGSGKTYYVRLQSEKEICDFIKNSIKKYKNVLSRSAKSTITKLQSKIERLKLFI